MSGFSLMTYQQCLDYLKRLGNEILTMKFGLTTTRSLLEALDNPQETFPTVLVAGTNGKGSVIRFLDSICTSSGIRTGLFTSPHLERIEERFHVDGRAIQSAEFARFFSEVLSVADQLKLETHPTFFELIAVTALHCFAERGVQLALLEVGMGGRLDSTNAVEPCLSIITPISLDHQQYLGTSLLSIAREKAGIMRSSRPTLIAPQTPEVTHALAEIGRRSGVRLEEFDKSTLHILGHEAGCYRFAYRAVHHALRVPGEHQVGNAALAVRAAEILASLGTAVTQAGITEGLASRTVMPGVIQMINSDPMVVLDGGHNPAAATALVRFVDSHTPHPVSMVFGIMSDKDMPKVLELLSDRMESIFLTRIDSPRAADPHELKRFSPKGIVIEDPALAYRAALKSNPAAIVVTGSFYLIGELLSKRTLSGFNHRLFQQD